jgi:hypothetical protein
VSAQHPKVRGLDLFRPASLADFGNSAKALQWLIGGKLMAAQELLARAYGHASVYALKAALRSFGAPGPFEQDLFKNRQFELATARRTRLRHFVAQHINVAHGLSPERKELVVELGLHDTPLVHRELVSIVKKAVGLIEKENWHWRNAIRFAELYAYPLPHVVGLESLVHNGSVSRYDPSNMLESLGQSRAASLFMAERPLIQADETILEFLREALADVDDSWLGADRIAEFAPSLSDAVRELQGLATWTSADDETDSDFGDEALDELWLEIDARRDKPWELTPLLAEHLLDYGELERLAPVWSELNRQVFATMENWHKKLAVTSGELRSAEEEILGFSGRVYLSFSLVSDGDEDDASRSMTLWRFRAVLVSEGDDKLFHAKVVMKGLVVEPSFAWTCPSEESFLNDMEWNNYDDVWGVITHSFLPSRGFENIMAFANQRRDESFIIIDEFASSCKLDDEKLCAVMRSFLNAFEEPVDWAHTNLSRMDEMWEPELDDEPLCVYMRPTVVLVPDSLDKIALELDRSGLKEVHTQFSKLNHKFHVNTESGPRAVDVLVYDNARYGQIGIDAWKQHWAGITEARRRSG